MKIVVIFKPFGIFYPSIGMDPLTIVTSTYKLATKQIYSLGHPGPARSKALNAVLSSSELVEDHDPYAKDIPHKFIPMKILFTELFGWGEAFLALTEEDNPLESGLELMASPPGKKLQQMSLLSGGEQALTSMALIFSVFLTKPSPICILDEVDAPLDESNVDRFLDLIESISEKSKTRFVVVTHNRLSMSRMHRLYGVTMQEPGVSQLVSVSLKEAEKFEKTE